MTSRYICKVTGKRYERFLKTLRQLHIRIYSISYQEKTMVIEVDEEGYEKLQKIKTTYEIEVISYKGKARIFFYFRKYRIFLSAILFGICLLLALSNLIWKVEVVHSKQEIRMLLTDALEEKGICPFRMKLSFQKKEKIKKEILETYKDKIEWLEIEEVGTKYVVRVEERKKNDKEEDTSPRHIIASKDAMILTIQAEAGEVVKKRFDYVKKGDVLISGIIHKNEEAKSKVKAVGAVYGEVWYTVSILLPVHYYEEKVIGTPKTRLALQALSKTFSLQKGTYRIKKTTPIFKSALFPLSLQIETVEEISQTVKHYDLENGEKEGVHLALEKLKVRLPEKSEILTQKVLKKQKKGSKIYIEVFFKVKEEITAYQSLKDVDLSLENEKQEESR